MSDLALEDRPKPSRRRFRAIGLTLLLVLLVPMIVWARDREHDYQEFKKELHAYEGVIIGSGKDDVRYALGIPKSVYGPEHWDRSHKWQLRDLIELTVPRRDQSVGIEDTAITAYTRDQYPTTFAKFGKVVPKINQDRVNAAKIAATIAGCDHVENSQISTRSPRVNRHYWVECSNLTRLNFDEASIAKGEPVTVQTSAEWMANGLKDW